MDIDRPPFLRAFGRIHNWRFSSPGAKFYSRCKSFCLRPLHFWQELEEFQEGKERHGGQCNPRSISLQNWPKKANEIIVNIDNEANVGSV